MQILYFLSSPYIKESVIKSIKASPFFSILFDRSLNEILQIEQMDIYVRYYNQDKATVVTSYLELRFFSMPNAENISDELGQALSCLDIANMIMLSMDGPNTNWRVLTNLSKQRLSEDLCDLIEAGSCGLHIVHGAFQAGVVAFKWKLNKVMTSMQKLIHDSPARRDVYATVAKSKVFPKGYFQKVFSKPGR